MAGLAEKVGRVIGFLQGTPGSKPDRTSHIRRILQVKLWAIGEVIFTTPAVRQLRRGFPKAKIDYLVGRTAAPVLENNPHIDNLMIEDEHIFLDPQPTAALALLGRLQKERYDLILLYHHTLFFNLYFRAVGARILAGIDRRGEGGPLQLASEMDESLHQADEYSQVPALLGATDDGEGMEIFVRDGELQRARKLLSVHHLRGKVAIIAPGGGVNPKTEMLDKRLPLAVFVGTAKELMSAGFGIVIVGGNGDEEVCVRMEKSLARPGVLNLYGHTNLRELFALLSLSDMVVANDSAVAHAAAALRRPQVTLFGPTSPVRVNPYRNPRGSFVASSVSCAPCYHDAKLADCQHHNCLQDYGSREVVAVIRRILAKKG
jgi:heptosyltransferase-2